jgi:hypothetical protein
MINITKCLKFISLQKDINNDIEMMGQTSIRKANQLDAMVEKLNKQELDYIIKTWNKVL